MGSGRFRSMGVGELLDAIFSLYRRNFLLIAAVSAAVQVPFAALRYLIYQVFDYPAAEADISRLSALAQSGAITHDELQSQLFNALGTLLLVVGILLVVELLVVFPLVEAATTRAVSDRYLDRPTSVVASYAAAVRRVAALVAQSLILLGGFIVLIAVPVGLMIGLSAAAGPVAGTLGVVLLLADVPLFIFIAVRVSLAPPSIVLEGLSGPRGLRRSWNLVRGSGWRMFGILLLLGLITALISGVVGLLLGLPGIGLDANGQLLLNQVAQAIAAVFVSPLTYIGITLLYYDMRIRKEGFDIEMLAASL